MKKVTLLLGLALCLLLTSCNSDIANLAEIQTLKMISNIIPN